MEACFSVGKHIAEEADVLVWYAMQPHLCIKCSLTILGKAAWMLRNRAEATLLARRVSLIYVTMKTNYNTIYSKSILLNRA